MSNTTIECNRPPHKLIIGISSRALFDLETSHEIYMKQGLEAYRCYQIENEDRLLLPGQGISLVKRLLNLNQYLTTHQVEVILLSRNSADTGLRIFNSIKQYGLNIIRAAFCGGSNPLKYIKPFNCHLFLSADEKDVREALAANCAAAKLFSQDNQQKSEHSELRIAFDGDAVLFSDESERIFQQKGLDAFFKNEEQSANKPLPVGPFQPFLSILQKIQQAAADHCPIRTALVTARSAPAHERVIRTLRSWDIRLDEALFLGDLEKGEFLKSFHADIFFDDQVRHCQSANQQDILSAHVPYGVSNEKK
ncbi:MAG: 5'-nucleotidase [Endozoicomonadaceae bacterium]|nr:5'-nucleotidase [Endozoicomonadaceae bacterium]